MTLTKSQKARGLARIKNEKKRAKKLQQQIQSGSPEEKIQRLEQQIINLSGQQRSRRSNRYARGFRGGYQKRYNNLSKMQTQFSFSKLAKAYFDMVLNPIDTVEMTVKPDAIGNKNYYLSDVWNVCLPTVSLASTNTCNGALILLVPLTSGFSITYGVTQAAYQIFIIGVDTSGKLCYNTSTKFSSVGSLKYNTIFGSTYAYNQNTAQITDVRLNAWGLRVLSPINNITAVATSSANYITNFHGGMVSLYDLNNVISNNESVLNLLSNSRDYKIFSTTDGCTVRMDPWDFNGFSTSLSSLYELFNTTNIDVGGMEVPYVYCQLGATTANGTSFTLPVNIYSKIHFEGKPQLNQINVQIDNEVDINIETAIKIVDNHDYSNEVYVTKGHSFKSFKNIMARVGRTGIKALKFASKFSETAMPYLELAASMA